MTFSFCDSERLAAGRLIELALGEDLATAGDITTAALVSADERGAVHIVARQPGVLAGLPIVEQVFARLDTTVVVENRLADGARLERGSIVARLVGPQRSLLTGERTALNFLTHLSGVATLTSRFVDLVVGTKASIYDTRKTLPGWRLLEKYAVRAGGGRNHRVGLYDMVLIKDNHLAGWRAATGRTIAEAVAAAREHTGVSVRIEVEVDSLDQLRDALNGHPDIVLLDNMDCPTLAAAVALRDQTAPQVELEASGGVTLDTVAAIARTGVDRISTGAVTHSAVALDLAFDWAGCS